MSELNHTVFIYGTLKSDQPNRGMIQHLVDKGSLKFLHTARTIDVYPLVIATVTNAPFLLDHQGVGKVALVCTK